MPSMLLVIPAYHESRRLPLFLPALCEAIAGSGLPIEVQIVDDGSGAEEQQRVDEWLTTLRQQYRFLRPLHGLAVNRGKGAAVYTGWDLATSQEWLAFVDADGAVPAAEVMRLAGMTGDPSTSGKAIFAVRVRGAGRTVTRTFARQVTGRVFRWLVHLMFDLPVPDTQCGFKIVPAAEYGKIRAQIEENRFCFDVELTCLLAANGCKIISVPIDWHESPGGKVHPQAVREMFFSLLRLRSRLKRKRIPAVCHHR